jgi:hypothetical protein
MPIVIRKKRRTFGDPSRLKFSVKFLIFNMQ